ncbi:MAG: glycoside hydrolase family 1 protein [Anaerolineae bacterium]|nr:glycoside hydrolase family 1 protein [Anaerolineae bacterium]
MPEATFHFPSDFVWGCATAAHQVEGHNSNNDWWAWEQVEDHVEDGRRSGLACDWWARAEEDLARAAELGQTGHRLSVEWSRIEPAEGRFDTAALDRYREILRAARTLGIEPLVTLHHFTLPLWLAEMGGWEHPRAVPLFDRYVAHVVEALGEFCDFWCTINEPNVVVSLGHIAGIFPPGQRGFGAAMKAGRSMMRAHAAAYRRIHALQPPARVGFAHNMRILDPANRRSPLDRWAAGLQDRFFNQTFLTAVDRGWWQLPLGFGPALRLRKTLDWVGLNYYTRDLVAFDRHRPEEMFGRRSHKEEAELLDGGYGEFYPQGMGRCLRRLAPLGLPIYITENGIPDDDDDQRPRYLLTHLYQVWETIQHNYPIMGYYHWSLVDNFEWAKGWTLRFGLIEVDPDSQARTPRRSAYLYRDICRANAITPAMIDEYAPELRAELLPG